MWCKEVSNGAKKSSCCARGRFRGDRGSDYERETLKNLSTLVNECEPYGIPVMAVTAVGKEMEKRQARYLALSCRIAAELGARVVKTYWCEKDFDKVVNGCPVPVIIAGGPKCDTELEVLEFEEALF